MQRKIKTLIVDDSALVRQTLREILSSDPEIEVMDAAGDPFFAAKIIKNEVPDVITLDIEMPRMDGLTFLGKIMTQHPIPVVICSSLAGKGTEAAIRALEYGAVEVIQKPRVGTKEFLEESRIQICDIVKAAANAEPKRVSKLHVRDNKPKAKLTADAVIAESKPATTLKTTEKVLVVGASTGGFTDCLLQHGVEQKHCAYFWKHCRWMHRASLLFSTCQKNLPHPLPSGWTTSAIYPSKKRKITIQSFVGGR